MKKAKVSVDGDEAPINELTSYAYCNGIVMTDKLAAQCVTHAPFALEPYNFPELVFHEAMELASIFNELVDKVARNEKWLIETLKITAESDEFTGHLLQILRDVQTKGCIQSCYFAINRSDYMLHHSDSDAIKFLQVELNTIASSFGSLSSKIANMYKAVYGDKFYIPPNNALEKIVYAMHLAHEEYIKQSESSNCIMVMVVQPNERNFADQCLMQFVLKEKHMIDMHRVTFQELLLNSTFEPSGIFRFKGLEVSVVYFRSGYAPGDYITPEIWDLRRLIELSRAIKCPNVAYHLAGTKKVQQVLANPGELEKFLSESDCIRLRKVFAGLYNLTSDSQDTASEVKAVIDRVINNPLNFVMKPQREGGGNNIYGKDVLPALQSMPSSEIASYILMERIASPLQKSKLFKNGNVSEVDSICELGVYGVFLSHPNTTPIINENAGYLLRVKPADSDEGGVATGYSVLSSPCW